MSLSSSLSIATSGLSTTSTQLQVTASNVANAATDGYTRKTATTAPAHLGTVGGGVQVTGFARTTNNTLFTSLSKATTNAGLRGAQDDYLQQVQDLLGTSGSDQPGLSSTMTALMTAWTAFGAEPESQVAQQNVIQSAVNFVDEIQRISKELEELDRQARNDITSTIKDLNGYLQQISDLNSKISLATTSGQSAGDLEDQRDQLVLKIAEITGVRVLPRSNGQIALYTDTGYQLVDGSTVRSFAYDGTSVYDDKNPSLSLNNTLTEGKLEAILNLRDTSAAATSNQDPAVGTFEKLRDQLDLIANAFLTTTTTATSGEATFAQAYNSATTGAGELAAGFFTGTSRLDFAVNANLLSGASKLKLDSADGVVDALMDSTRSFSASGLNVSGATYSNLTTASITVFQQAANNVGGLNDNAVAQQDYLKQKLTNATNVNTDEEMVNLVTLQNVYAANARIISVVQELFSILQQTVS